MVNNDIPVVTCSEVFLDVVAMNTGEHQWQ